MQVTELIANCQRQYEHGDFDGALNSINEALRLKQNETLAWIWLAVVLQARGDTSKALMAISIAAVSPIHTPGGTSPELYELFSRGHGEHNSRYAEVFKPCPIFGPMRPNLEQKAERIISSILDQNLDAWESGELPKPRLAHAIPERLNTGRSHKLMIIGSEYIDSTEQNIRNDITDVFFHSARLNGFEVRRATSSENVLLTTAPRTSDDLDAALGALEAEITEFRPDVILIDANGLVEPGVIEGFGPHIRPEFFDRVRHLNCRVAAVFPDLYEHTFNQFEYWAEKSDIVIVFNDRSTQTIRSRYYHKRLYWASLPFRAETYQTDRPKEFEISIIGGATRGRELFANYLSMLRFPGKYQLHNRSAASALSSQGYVDALAASKMIFNNGTLSANNRIVTARALEAIWAKALLLEESGSDVEHLFVPYVHYIPVANMTQFVSFCQYFQKHPARREAIADRAFKWATQYYSAPKFWQTFLAQVGLT
jgi:hypothetical protein